MNYAEICILSVMESGKTFSISKIKNSNRQGIPCPPELTNEDKLIAEITIAGYQQFRISNHLGVGRDSGI